MPVIAMVWLASAGEAEVVSAPEVHGARARDARSAVSAQVPGWMTAAGEIMSVALAEHTGPWAANDVEALPDAGDHACFEVYEGGVLVVSPAPGVGHQRASHRLYRALAQAATATGADAEVPEAVNVALSGGKLLFPA